MMISWSFSTKGDEKRAMGESRFRADVQAVKGELDKAEYMLSVRRYDLAIETLQKALRDQPENSAIFYTLARVYVGKKWWVDAERSIREALRLDPRTSASHMLYGNILLNMRRIDEAEAAYQASLALQPRSANTHYLYALLLLENRHDPVRAREHASQALELDPAAAGHHMALAKIMASTGEFTEAEQEFERALSLDPENVLVRRVYGWYLLYKRRRPEQALEQVRYAMQLDPMDANVRKMFIQALKAKQKLYGPIWYALVWLMAGWGGNWRKGKTEVNKLRVLFFVALLILAAAFFPPLLVIEGIIALVLVAFGLYDSFLTWQIKQGKLK